MELSEILKNSNVKLLDTSAFLPRGRDDLYSVLYEAKSHKHVPLDLIALENSALREGIQIISLKGVYSIEEVAKELQTRLKKCENSSHFFGNPAYGFANERDFGLDLKKDSSGKGNRVRNLCNKKREKIRKERLQEPYSRKTLREIKDSFNSLSKSLIESIRVIKNKDVRKRFSNVEERMYIKFINYFTRCCNEFGLQRDYSGKYHGNKIRNPCDFGTDIKLMATAFSLAQNQEVDIIGTDSDLFRMINQFNCYGSFKDTTGVIGPKFQVRLFSNFGEGYFLSHTTRKN